MVTMAFDPDYSLILSAYETDDDIGKVLRTHLVIERVVEQLITTQSRAKVDGRTTFVGKINLLRAMRIPEKICVACEAINDLRNKFAHNPAATMANTKSISERFLNAVSEMAPALPRAHGTFTRKSTRVEHEFKYAEASQAQRVVIAASFLSSIIAGLPAMLKFRDPQALMLVAGLAL